MKDQTNLYCIISVVANFFYHFKIPRLSICFILFCFRNTSNLYRFNCQVFTTHVIVIDFRPTDSSKQAFLMCMLWETWLLILWSYTMSWEELNMSITLANLPSRLWRYVEFPRHFYLMIQKILIHHIRGTFVTLLSYTLNLFFFHSIFVTGHQGTGRGKINRGIRLPSVLLLSHL